MTLSFMERVLLLRLLPREGSFDTLRQVHDLRLELALGDDEREAAGWRLVGEGTEQRATWDEDPMKDIPMDGTRRSVVVEALQKVNRDKTATPEMLPLWERFVESED